MMRRVIAAAIVLPSAFWLSMLVNDVRRLVASPSDWLEVASIHVDDTAEGETNRMQVVRTIHAPFYGEWIATIRNVSDGTLAGACLAEGKASYAIDAGETLGINHQLDAEVFIHLVVSVECVGNVVGVGQARAADGFDAHAKAQSLSLIHI